MTLLEAMKCIGPIGADGGGAGDDDDRRNAAAVVVWEALASIRLRITEEVLEDARGVLFTRLFSRLYTLSAATDFQCRAYLRRALYHTAIDAIRRRVVVESTPPDETAAAAPAAEPRPEMLLDMIDDLVAMWGGAQFSMARDRLLSQDLLRRTIEELVAIASGQRQVRDVLLAEDSAAAKDLPQRWSTYKRRCQRTIRALLLLLPHVAVERGWVDPSFRAIPFRKLKDLQVVAEDPQTSPQLRQLVMALVVVATGYQRALVAAVPQRM